MNGNTENPHNLLTQSIEWINFEYNLGRGSRSGLYDYVKRKKLLADLENRPTSQVELNAWKYLLKLEGE